jgi:hypothetical protein
LYLIRTEFLLDPPLPVHGVIPNLLSARRAGEGPYDASGAARTWPG